MLKIRFWRLNKLFCVLFNGSLVKNWLATMCWQNSRCRSFYSDFGTKNNKINMAELIKRRHDGEHTDTFGKDMIFLSPKLDMLTTCRYSCSRELQWKITYWNCV
jgi:hypothetical protein